MPDPDRGPLQGIVKYNPHLWDDDELRSIFVARNRELTELLDRLRQTPAGAVPQHALVVGQRGMGKTTLLRRLALRVREDAELSRQWIALSFPEEQFTVSTLAELWSNVLDALTDALETEGAPLAELDRLDGEIRRIGALPTLEREEAAIGLLDEWIDRHQRRILLLIDSTDLLFDGLGGSEDGKRGQKAGDTALWRLRKTLTHHGGFFWLGASYRALEAGHLYGDAFHDFFELVELRPLSADDMREAMLALARTFGAGQEKPGEAAFRAMGRILDARPERLRALRDLTGGNPRTTVMLYELFADDRQDNLHADLKRLLDMLTPLYKARMENLADQPRKLLAHVMEHWAPMAAADLAEAAGIPATTVSGQLARLEAEGLIEKAKLTGRRRAGYQVAERFFNIWYLMRYTPRRLRQSLTWLVEFMRMWYSIDELRSLAGERACAHAEGRLCHGDHLKHSRALAAVLLDEWPEKYRLEWSVFSVAQNEAHRLRRPIAQIFPDLFDQKGADKPFCTAEDYGTRFAALDELLARCSHVAVENQRVWIDAVKGNLELTLAEKESIANETAALSVEEYTQLMEILNSKIERLKRHLGENGYTKLRKAVLSGDFFPDCPDPELAYKQARALFSDDADALRCCGLLLEQYHLGPWVEKIYRDAINLDPNNARPWNTLGVLLHERFGRHDEAEAVYRHAIALNPELARPWYNLGLLLHERLSRYDEAEAAYRTAITLDPKNTLHWNNLGLLLHERLGRHDEAEAAYRTAITLDPEFARPWYNLGLLLHERLGRHDEAVAAYGKAITLDPKDPRPWYNLGNLLHQGLSRYNEAEAAYRTAIELDPKDPRSWHNLAVLLENHLGRYDEAEAAYRTAIELDPKHDWPWHCLGVLLENHLGRYDEAEIAYRKAIELDPTNAQPWHCLGVLLENHLGRYDEAEIAYRKAIELDPKFVWPWHNLGLLLEERLGRYDEAETAYRKAIDLDPKDTQPWNNLGNLLQIHLGRYDEAEIAYRKAIELDRELAWPWYNLGNLLQDHSDRYEEAETAYRKAIELDSNNPLPWNDFGDLLQGLNRYQEAEEAYRKAIQLDPDDPCPRNRLGDLLQYLNRYSEADEVYRQIQHLYPTDPYPAFHQAKVLTLMNNKSAADEAFHQAVNLAARYLAQPGASSAYWEILLQAHLWLHNRDSARQALEKEASSASNGDAQAFYRLRRQARECYRIGLGPALAELMAQSPHANFLKPIALALRAAAGEAEALDGILPELRTMAEEVMRDILPQGRKAVES